MSKDDLFRNTLATNGLARGYAPRAHKRKRKGLRFAVVVLLLAVGGVVYVDQSELPIEPFEIIEQLNAPNENEQADKQFN